MIDAIDPSSPAADLNFYKVLTQALLRKVARASENSDSILIIGKIRHAVILDADGNIEPHPGVLAALQDALDNAPKPT